MEASALHLSADAALQAPYEQESLNNMLTQWQYLPEAIGHASTDQLTHACWRTGKHDTREVPREGALPSDPHDDKGHGGLWN